MSVIPELTLANRIGEGQFADVFALPDGGTVCKLYRTAGSAKWREWAPRIHQEELAAYALAVSLPATRGLLARCDGAAAIGRVLGMMGEDISDMYLLETGILLERLHGLEEKAFGLDKELHPQIEELMDALWNVGVDATDASAFGSLPGETLRFVDVTTHLGARLVAEVI